MFNDVWLTRDDGSGNRVQTMKVPLNYGPKEKFLARLEGNPNLDRQIAITLPRMSFEIINFAYDPQRKMNTIGRISSIDPDDPGKSRFQYNPIPYDIEFSLYIMVKNAEDGTRIVEQILPFFAPEWTATLNLNPDLGIKYDIPVMLNSISQQDTYEGAFTERRAIIWTLNFTMKAYIFGPTRSGKIIKQTEINIKIPENGVSVDEAPPTTPNSVEITITPGLTANGEPTSNASLSIDKSLIKATDNYGFIIDFNENF